MNRYYYEHLKTDMKQPVYIHIHHQNEKAFILEEHWHKGIEINYILNARADFYIDDQYIPGEKGDIMIINSESVHKVVAEQGNQDIEGHKAITVIIPTELFSKCIEDFDKLRFVVKPQDDAVELKKIILEIAKTQEQESVEYDYMHLMSLTWQLLFHLCQNYQEKQEKTEEGQAYSMELICQIMNYINEHFCEDLSVQAIADEFNFSREYISRVFKRYTGTTIMEQIIQTRMDYAHKQLVKTQRSIESIAVISGFGDARNFIKYFKRFFNNTPLQYRKKLQNGNF